MPGENILSMFQKYMTIVQRLDDLTKEVADVRTSLTARVDRQEARIDDLQRQVSDTKERLARLEAARNLDRAEAQTEVERFKLQMERAELRLRQLLPPAAKPNTDTEPGREE